MNSARFNVGRFDDELLTGFGGERLSKKINASKYVWRDPSSFPRRQWVYGDFVRRFLSCTFAPSGVGKSSLALGEAVAMASGRSLLGIVPKGGPKRVWYWNGEDPLEEIERRVGAILLHFEIHPDELGERLYLNSGRDCEIIIAMATRSGAVIAEPVVDAFMAEIAAEAIDVIILDPFISVHEVPENDNPAIAKVCKTFAQIADRTNSAIELVHHVRKTGGAEITVEDGRGAVAMLAASRSARVLNVMTKDEGSKAGVERHRSYFRVTNGKSSMTEAPPAEASDWYRIVSVPLGNGDDDDEGDKVGVVAAWQWPDVLATVSVDDLRKVQVAVDKQRCRANVQAKAWVGNVVATVLGLDLKLKSDKARVAELIKIWLASGALVTVEGFDDKREKRSFVEVGQWAD